MVLGYYTIVNTSSGLSMTDLVPAQSLADAVRMFKSFCDKNGENVCMDVSELALVSVLEFNNADIDVQHLESSSPVVLSSKFICFGDQCIDFYRNYCLGDHAKETLMEKEVKTEAQFVEEVRK